MKTDRKWDARGLTLMEVTFALAIFAVVTAITAQALVTFYVAIDIQEQRIEAIRVCKDVAGAVRDQRGLLDPLEWPDNLVAWVENKNEEGWPEYQRLQDQGEEDLPGQAITVECTNRAGGAPTAGDTVLEVRVFCTWLDRSGRPLEAEIVTYLASE